VTALIGPSAAVNPLPALPNRITIPFLARGWMEDLAGRQGYLCQMSTWHFYASGGMVFQKPNPFQSIYDMWHLDRSSGLTTQKRSDEIVERSLRQAALWEDVKDHLKEEALGYPGSAAALCIARVLAVKPEVILMDEPASALDPIATLHIEELIAELKSRYTIVIVTHNMQQAARVSDHTGLFWLGELVEFSSTDVMFTRPEKQIAED
jgi:phosphate transport system ATP-binding protein